MLPPSFGGGRLLVQVRASACAYRPALGCRSDHVSQSPAEVAAFSLLCILDQGPSGCPISLEGSAPGFGTYLSIQGPPN